MQVQMFIGISLANPITPWQWQGPAESTLFQLNLTTSNISPSALSSDGGDLILVCWYLWASCATNLWNKSYLQPWQLQTCAVYVCGTESYSSCMPLAAFISFDCRTIICSLEFRNTVNHRRFGKRSIALKWLVVLICCIINGCVVTDSVCLMVKKRRWRNTTNTWV